jgi:hypothetical protein
MTTRFKLLIAFFLDALMMLLATQSQGQYIHSESVTQWRKQTLKEDLDWCIVHKVDYCNAFAEVQMVCNYYDWVVIGKSKQTLFISKKGFIIQRWWRI